MGCLRRFTEHREVVVESYLDLAAVLTVLRHLINRVRTTHRWPDPAHDSVDDQVPDTLR
jgi:hypothetical protein